ncbi:Fis family transcriptional regulator [Sulfodiicoccus acidiphilus]|uniref:Fis family transcriptional regulator n=1 Tax=Sulfodiicoccus acidiphilus TaxID=1670455 RepID=A0A348B6K7_9CREN|nr:Fis family transcriptional regulator [Sulfodiicoccus acidiphilus]BBD73809.1 Fis family transcriptional regulator [Sulfodiicoccus acidiphilus]GGU03575.1 Fis family transcriptional regulator [Sulfodiicoccus acidiphilus]
MSLVYPSREWAEAYCKALSEDKAYNDAGKGWQWDVVLSVVNLPTELSRQLNADKAALKLQLREGKCLGVEFAIGAVPDAPYVLEADYSTWSKVIQGKLEVVGAMLSGTIRLKRGSMVSLARYTNAAVAMARVTTKLSTKFLS